jgi:RimJ/RimL family protein N-acetyltransferase/catechol 2,3-dioxygenase-like lactoylglutathione lyase family enzyme
VQPPELTTDRLRLRALRRTDAAALLEPWSDPETLRHWHRATRATEAECAAVVEEMLAPPGACLWAICARGDDRALGHVGFVDHAPGRRAPFGYLLRRDRWGQGLVPEAARAALRAGFETLGVAGAELWIFAENRRSQRVAEKLGATARGRFVALYPERGGARETLVYGVTAAEFGVEHPAPDPVAVYGLTPILETGDVAAAVDFYCEKLGFHLDWKVGDPPEAASVSRGDWTPQVATIRFTLVREDPAVRSGVLALTVDDVDRLAAELRAAGVVIQSGPATQPWGLRELDVLDALGQRLRFFSAV